MAGVSFVTTVYNKSREIEAAALSMFAQDGGFDREFVFVDDGSTDDSPAILARLAESRDDVRVIRRVNGGPASAFNEGVRAARFPLVKPMDGDDVLARDAVAVLMAGMDKSGADMVFGRKVVLTEADNPGTVRRAADPAFVPIPDALRLVIDASLSGCSEVLVKRDAFLAVGGCDERLFIQDQSYIRRLAAKGHPIARGEEKVVFSPPSRDDALCYNSPQIDHDNNASWMCLVDEMPGLDAGLKRLALKKSASRAWKYAHRVQNRFGLFDPTFWTYVLSYLPLTVTPESFLPTLEPYRRTGKVRRPSAAVR